MMHSAWTEAYGQTTDLTVPLATVSKKRVVLDQVYCYLGVADPREDCS